MMRKYIYKLILATALTGACGVQIAHAGFEFTAPIQTTPMQQQTIPSLNGGLLPTLPSVMPAVPTAAVNTQPTTWAPRRPVPAPAVVNAPPQPLKPQIQTGLSSIAPVNTAPIQWGAQRSTPVAAPSPIALPVPNANPVMRDEYEMAVGFGKDLPLVTALRQIVPNDYAYILNESIPMGETVSWNGGRQWTTVLDDMIAPLGLRSAVHGKRVVIDSLNPTPKTQTRPMNQVALADLSYGQEAQTMNDAQPAPRPDVMMQAQSTSAPLVGQFAPMSMPATSMKVNAPLAVAQFSAPAAPIPSRVVPQVTHGTWSASRGDSLRSVLEEWAGQAGAELFWSSDYNFPLAGAVNISGTFEEATENLLKGFEQARPKPIARLHPNLPHGPAVLVVETRQSLE